MVSPNVQSLSPVAVSGLFDPLSASSPRCQDDFEDTSAKDGDNSRWPAKKMFRNVVTFSLEVSVGRLDEITCHIFIIIIIIILVAVVVVLARPAASSSLSPPIEISLATWYLFLRLTCFSEPGSDSAGPSSLYLSFSLPSAHSLFIDPSPPIICALRLAGATSSSASLAGASDPASVSDPRQTQSPEAGLRGLERWLTLTGCLRQQPAAPSPSRAAHASTAEDRLGYGCRGEQCAAETCCKHVF
ncbi:unnamed protein product [Protopolystoma xenopodis]|uniref:Uncharacterized protein n=1 Tax=Protopolystoma xenopodis TaxID=117903 RepID=A0A3S5C6D7_9PLAT|nr:unnamed protein product [Protopolystoma xenopodis]